MKKMLLENTIVGKCPEPGCGGDLVVKTNGRTGHQFAGCNNYPNCNHTEDIPEEFKLGLQNAPQLPL